ncbi:hypothetical protein COLO4_12804 [Corchorus olitorius]|uniref:Uncharacterized protein n=1 Tax=Corchorus olitorius TaxID=93759 RepID=A0A1R3JZL0_9ROSI|nr:hypothetical protein COLO4_12804 [Corchorus olitorius]
MERKNMTHGLSHHIQILVDQHSFRCHSRSPS